MSGWLFLGQFVHYKQGRTQCRINLCGNCGMATEPRAFVDHIFKISCAPSRVPAMSTTIRATSSIFQVWRFWVLKAQSPIHWTTINWLTVLQQPKHVKRQFEHICIMSWRLFSYIFKMAFKIGLRGVICSAKDWSPTGALCSPVLALQSFE